MAPCLLAVQILAELDIPFSVRGVMFAKQAPNTGVAPHSDARNFILTLHLGKLDLRGPFGGSICTSVGGHAFVHTHTFDFDGRLWVAKASGQAHRYSLPCKGG